MNLTCEYCGKEFERKPSQISGHNFCSRECSANWRKETGVLKKEKNPRWNSVQIQCENCGKDIWLNQYRMKHSKHHFCSIACEYAFLGKAQRGSNHPLWKGGNIKTSCAICGKPVSVYPIRYKEGRNFCSKECASTFHSKEMLGKNNPSWRGGTSFEDYCINFNDAIKEEAREKYGRQCFLCGKTEAENGKKLCVHHVDYDKKRGCNGKKLLLVPLCTSCHAKTNFRRDYWESIIRAKMRKRKLSHSQTILDVFF